MKKSYLAALQIAVTLAVLAFVFRDPAKRAEILHTFGNADLAWLLAGIGVYGLVEASGVHRWHSLLRVQGVQMPWQRTAALTMVGLFFNFFLPGGTGGDVVKGFYLLKETAGQRTAALLSIVVDRLLGLLSIAVIAGAFALTRWHWLTQTADTARLVWITVAVFGGSLGFAAFSLALSRFGAIHRMPARMPGRDRLAELALAYSLYGHAWRTTLGAFLTAAAANLGTFLTFYCATRALAGPGVHLPTLGELFAVMPIVNTLSSVAIAGLGVREGLFETFLHQLAGVPGAVALAISSTGFLLTLFWGLIGGLIYMAYRPSEHRRLGEIANEIAAAEHDIAEEEIAMESRVRK